MQAQGPSRIQRGDKSFYPEEVSSVVLKKMKETAEAQDSLGRLLPMPWSFSKFQWQATKDAGIITGFNVLRILSEPTTAAIAYDIRQER